MSKEVVISYYGEDLYWIKNIKSRYKFIVYNKTDVDVPHTIKLDNIGRETNTYFYHIINNYDNLSDWVFFSQGDPIEHVKDYEFILNNFPKSLDKSKLSNNECHFFANGLFKEKLISYSNGTPYHQGFLNINHLWERLFECNPPEVYEFTPGAIFCVSKNQIQKRNKEFYEKCLKITEEVELSPWEFERMMSYVFNNNII